MTDHDTVYAVHFHSDEDPGTYDSDFEAVSFLGVRRTQAQARALATEAAEADRRQMNEELEGDGQAPLPPVVLEWRLEHSDPRGREHLVSDTLEIFEAGCYRVTPTDLP